MRDILVSLVIVYLIWRTFRKLEYGAYLWTWLSLMNPHRLAHGFAVTMPWAQLSALSTFVALVFSKERKPLPLNGGVVALVLLWLWMTVTAFTSINPPDMVWERWVFVSKINVMLLVTLMLLRGRQQIDRLIWVVALSVGFFGIKGGVFTIGTGGAYRVWGPPGSMIEENNALAIGLIIVLPLFYYLRETVPYRRLRPVLLGAMLLIVASILGSQSRGALVALMATGLFLGLKSRHPVRFSLGALVVFAVGVTFMPEEWSARMDTIQDHENEGSAMSRLYTWETLWNVAVARPLFGAGFRADTLEIFNAFAPTDSRYDAFAGKAWVAHSIYLQALGEHGFVGLALFLWIWAWVWLTSARLASQCSQVDGLKDWVPVLMRMCQVALIGYCVGGAFLSLMNLDLPYYLLLVVTLVKCAVKDHLAQVAGPTPATAQPRMGLGPGVGASRGTRP